MVKDILLRLGIDITGAKEGLQEGTKEFKEYEKSVNKAKKETDGMLDASSQMPGVMGQAAGGVKNLIGTVRTLTTTLLANPLGVIFAAVSVAVAGLVAIFKDFAPITDYIGDKIAYLSGAFRGLQSAMFSFASGTGFTTEAIGEQAEAMERASQMQRTYEDNIDALNLKQTDYEVQIDKLLKQAKNKSISDKEANELIKEATRLQGLQIEQLKQISKFETSMLVEKAKGYGATYKQILAIQNGASIESLGNLSNELDGALSKLQQNYEKRKGEEGALDERKIKIENAQAAREEKIKAEEEKRAAERLKIKEDEKKREEAESKDRADRAKEYDDQQAKQLENDRARTASLNESDREQYAAHIADLRSIAADETLSEEERVAALIELNKKKQLSDEETAAASVAIAQKEKDAKVALLDAYSSILGAAAEIAGKDTAAGKALAVASATIATYTAIAKTLAANAANTPLAIASSIAIGLQGFAAVRNILAVKVPNSGGAGGGGGGSMPSMSLPTTRPSSGFTMLGNEDPLRTTNEGGMVRVFVTESDITTSQNRVSSIQAKATIG
jgi:hypothetical protein